MAGEGGTLAWNCHADGNSPLDNLFPQATRQSHSPALSASLESLFDAPRESDSESEGESSGYEALFN